MGKFRGLIGWKAAPVFGLGRPYIQATGTFSNYEIPISSLNGAINDIEVYAIDNGTDQIVCGSELVPNPYSDAYFALDIDHIDFRQ